MKRREFIKLSVATAVALSVPNSLFGENESFDYSKFDSIQFDRAKFDSNSPQILAIFLPGGSSQLGGNLTNLEDIMRLSESSYPNNMTVTENGFWEEAGGSFMESMLSAKQLSIVRTIFREKSNTRSHGIQISQNQTGSLYGDKSGFFTDILYVLDKFGAISDSNVMPALSFTGGTPEIFKRGDLSVSSYLNFASMDMNLENPYSMVENKWLKEGGDSSMQELADKTNSLHNSNELFQTANSNFLKKRELSEFVETISEKEVSIEFPDTDYGKAIKSSLKMMINNSDSKLSFVEFGGWDDHSGAINNYKSRMSNLFEALKSGADYLKSSNNRTISIWVFTEFGRNVNLNKSLGWDHGNILNLYVIGNEPNYLKMGKVIGETEIFKPDLDGNRIYMRPVEGSEKYEPFSIASTIESIFGIKNPEVLTEESTISSLLV
jgi:uncharacterized protein (DUF1501 family)